MPISAMIVLAVGGDSQQAVDRIYETLVGAAVGVVVNLVIAPPLHVRPAAQALDDVPRRMAQVLRGLADDLRGEWSWVGADRWLDGARALGEDVARADHALAQAEQSSRLNPRGSVARQAQPKLRTGLAGLEHAYVALRSLCRALLDRTYYVPTGGQVYSEPAREALALVLEEAAAGFCAAGAHVLAADADADLERTLQERRSTLLASRDRLSALLVVDPAHDEAAWQQHGALLASVDRLRVELEAVTAPSVGTWRPPPVALLPRHALRRLVLTSSGS